MDQAEEPSWEDITGVGVNTDLIIYLVLGSVPRGRYIPKRRIPQFAHRVIFACWTVRLRGKQRP
jgi:hypothetical protein